MLKSWGGLTRNASTTWSGTYLDTTASQPLGPTSERTKEDDTALSSGGGTMSR